MWRHSGTMVSDKQGIFIVQKLTSQNGGAACRLVLRVTFRLRKVVQSPEGKLYILTDEKNGKMIRIKNASR